MKAIRSIADRHGLLIVEDNARGSARATGSGSAS
jgi:dTDP-4-amino-4,6-dideoxygalactose transaminase